MVKLQQSTVEANDGDQATVRVVPIYILQTGCTVQDAPIRLKLVWNPSMGNWQIDGSSRAN